MAAPGGALVFRRADCLSSATSFPFCLYWMALNSSKLRPTEGGSRNWHVDGAGKWDRILALCRQERYPKRRGAKQNCDSERPAKTAGRSSPFRPKASAPRLHQRNGLDFDLALRASASSSEYK